MSPLNIEIILFNILVGLFSSTDNFGIGLAFGQGKARFPVIFSVLYTLIPVLMFNLSASAAGHVALLLNPSMSHRIGNAIFAVVGLGTAVQSLYEILKPSDFKVDDIFGFDQMMFLGLSQGMRTLAIGFAVGFDGLSTLYGAIAITVIGLFLLNFGKYIGVHYSVNWTGARISMFMGLVFAFLGVFGGLL